MSISLHQVAAPLLKQMLGALSDVLAKGAADAEARKIDPSVFLTARLAPDMFNLTRQVQIASDMSKAGLARLAGVEYPSYDDNEASFADLQVRLAKTLAFIDSIPAAAVDGQEDRVIVIKIRDRELTFTGQTYLINWMIPQVLFHVTTAYDILRHNGVQIGKRDFIGTF